MGEVNLDQPSRLPLLITAGLALFSLLGLAMALTHQPAPGIVACVAWLSHAGVWATVASRLARDPATLAPAVWRLIGGVAAVYAGLLAATIAFAGSHDASVFHKEGFESLRPHVLPPLLMLGAALALLGGRMVLQALGRTVGAFDREVTWAMLGACLLSLPIQVYAATPGYAVPPETHFDRQAAPMAWCLIAPTMVLIIGFGRWLTRGGPTPAFAVAATWWTVAFLAAGAAALTLGFYLGLCLAREWGPLYAVICVPLVPLAVVFAIGAWLSLRRAEGDRSDARMDGVALA